MVYAAKSRPHHINKESAWRMNTKFLKNIKAARTVKSISHNLDVIYI